MPLLQYLYSGGALNEARLARHLDMLAEDGSIHRYTVRPGAPVEGRDLFGRESQLDALLQGIGNKRSFHLRAPRRYGKTSLLRQVQQSLDDAGRPCLMVDLSSGNTAVWLLITLTRAAMAHPVCHGALDGVEELETWPSPEAGPLEISQASQDLAQHIDSNPWSFGQRLLEALGTVDAVLLLDELSVFLRAAVLRDEDEARSVAGMLQHCRTSGLVTQVLCGSTGLSRWVLFHDLGEQFDDLETLELPPLGEDEGVVLAEELLYGAELAFAPETVEAMARELGEMVPYFVHLLADALRADLGPGGVAGPDQVRATYTQRLLGPWANFSFRLYRLGAQPYPVDLLPAARRILRRVTATAEGVSQSDLLDELSSAGVDSVRLRSLLACLQEDYDLVERDGSWVMRCKPLRDRWALAESWLTGA